MMRLKMLCLVLLLPASLCWGLVGGQPTASYPSVFIWTEEAIDLDLSYCTATKVSATMFVTAAHCVLASDFVNGRSRLSHWRALKTMLPGQKIRLSFAKKITEDVKVDVLTLRALHFPPLLAECLAGATPHGCRATRTPVPDIALVEVENPFLAPSFYDAPAQGLDYDAVRQGDRITLMGYGSQSEDDIEAPILKAATQSAYVVSSMRRFLRDTEASVDGFPNPQAFFGSPGQASQPHYANLGSGDSGGPVINSAGLIVGVNSDGYCLLSAPECEVSTNSFFAMIDDYSLGFVGIWLRSMLETPLFF